MRNPRILIVAAFVGLVMIARAQQTGLLRFDVRSVQTGSKFSAYVGSGPGIELPPGAVQGDQMSLIIVENGHTYMAGSFEPRSPDVTLVQITLEVTNVSPKSPNNFGLSMLALPALRRPSLGSELGQLPLARTRSCGRR